MTQCAEFVCTLHCIVHTPLCALCAKYDTVSKIWHSVLILFALCANKLSVLGMCALNNLQNVILCTTVKKYHKAQYVYCVSVPGVQNMTQCKTLHFHLCEGCTSIAHSLIISREVLILTMSIFNALKVCISWYSLATGLISEAMTYKDQIIQYSPCALGNVRRNTSLGTVFPRTLPRESIGNTSSRRNIDNAPAMM